MSMRGSEGPSTGSGQAKTLVTFWIEREIAAAAEALARKEGLTRASYARRSLLRDLEEANRPTA